MESDESLRDELMAKIFISYRPEDTEAVANHLKFELEKYVGKGKVFLDSKGIQPGRDSRDVLQRSVKGSDCLLALIGPKWLNIGDSETKQRRLDNPDDFVRQEIRGALKNKKMPVIPVLVGDARMPEPEDLPDELKELASRQNFELRQRRWEDDVRALAEGLRLVSRQARNMPRITISYRRDDSLDIAGRIFDRLAAHFGREAVFRDIDNIPPGANFRRHIDRVLDESDIILAVVGPRWIGPRAGQSRLANTADPVRLEIETALRKNKPLIPVLVSRALMPRPDQLPESLNEFAYHNAAQVDGGQDFDMHIARLIRAIERIFEGN
jgi:hypothetical protein